MKVYIPDGGQIWLVAKHSGKILWQRRARRTRNAGLTLTK